MRKKVPVVTFDGKVIGDTENLSDTTTNSLGIETGWQHRSIVRLQEPDFGTLDVEVGRFFTHNGGSWFEARVDYSSSLALVIVKFGTGHMAYNEVRDCIMTILDDWSKFWYSARRELASKPKLTITASNHHYLLRLEEVINEEKRMTEVKVTRELKKAYPEQWAWGVLRDLIARFYLSGLPSF